MLKRFKEFITEEKEDSDKDHYYDQQIADYEKEVKDFNSKKFKLDSLIKTYDYSDNADRNLNKIIESNSLLLAYWSILKKKKRVTELNDQIKTLEEDIKNLKKDNASAEEIKKKQDQIKAKNDEILLIEKEYRELTRELMEKEKESKKKIAYLKQKQVK